MAWEIIKFLILLLFAIYFGVIQMLGLFGINGLQIPVGATLVILALMFDVGGALFFYVGIFMLFNFWRVLYNQTKENSNRAAKKWQDEEINTIEKYGYIDWKDKT